MKKIKIIFFAAIFLVLLLKISNVAFGENNDTTCVDEIELTINHEWILLKGQEIPDWLEGVSARNVCDENSLITIVVLDGKVNLNEEGVYTLIYFAYSEGETTITLQRFVDVYVRLDITKPVLNNVNNLEYEIYTDITEEILLENITAFDEFDGDITDNIQVDFTNLDSNTLGEYEITYYVTDSNYNTTSEKVTLSIVDKTAPIVNLLSDVINISVFSEEPNWHDYINVIDNYDNSPIININAQLVDFDVIGSYEVFYIVVDSEGNSTEESLTVNVVDNAGPIIILDSPIIEVFSEEPNWLDFIHVCDNYDEFPIIEYDASSVDLNKVGEYVVNYRAYDFLNNVTLASMKIIVKDTIPPEILNYHDIEYKLSDEEPDWFDGIIVVDNYDGIIANDNIYILKNTLDLYQEGFYYVTYIVKDSSNNYSTVNIIVRVKDDAAPTFENIKDFNISLTSNKPDFLKDIKAYDNIIGDITDRIWIDDSNINYNEVGNYKLVYIVDDLSGNITLKTVNVNIVEDITPPLINGVKDLTVEVKTTEIDYLEGIYAVDDYDEVSVEANYSNVNLNKIGRYVIKYLSVDKAGNISEVECFVNVVDTTPPKILGVKDITIRIKNNYNPLKNIEVTDNYDEMNYINIVISGNYNISKAGKYYMTIKATDSSGNLIEEHFTLTVKNNYDYIVSWSVGGLCGLSTIIVGFIFLKYYKREQK